MSQESNAMDIAEEFDFVNNVKKANSIISDQEITLCCEQAYIQQVNAEIKKLKTQTTNMKTETSKFLSDNAEKQQLINDIAQLKEIMMYSIDLSRKSFRFLGQQSRQRQEQINEWRQKYSDVLQEQNYKFNTLKRAMVEDRPLYEKVNKLKIEEKQLLVTLKHKSSVLDQTKNARKKKCEIAKQIYNADIVGFVKACQVYTSNKHLLEQIKELEQAHDKLKLRYKELNQITAGKEVKKSSNFSTLFKEWNLFEMPPPVSCNFSKTTPLTPSLLSSTKFSLFNKTSETPTRPMTSNFKMRSVSFKRKNSETLSQRKPEKLARTNSNVKILSVQTLNPPQDLNKAEPFDKFIAPTVPDKKHRDEIINEDKENNSNLQNQFNENKVIEAGDIKGCSQGSVKELPTSVQPQFEANNQSGAKKIAGFGNEPFNIANVTADEGDIFNITGDVDNEALLSMSADVDGGFVMSPTPVNEEESIAFFKPNNPSDHFFKLF